MDVQDHPDLNPCQSKDGLGAEELGRVPLETLDLSLPTNHSSNLAIGQLADTLNLFVTEPYNCKQSIGFRTVSRRNDTHLKVAYNVLIRFRYFHKTRGNA